MDAGRTPFQVRLAEMHPPKDMAHSSCSAFLRREGWYSGNWFSSATLRISIAKSENCAVEPDFS
jgi:hypothetical protein